MPTQDAAQTKEKILFFIKTNGPSLPVHVAKYIQLDTLFTSAFLSELFSEKTIRISSMKVGNSPLYFMPGQERSLERFSQHLKSREKDAFLLLKEKKFLKDSEQNPAIRVALRAIRDFAVPFKRKDEIFWRYHTVPESEFTMPVQEIKREEKIIEPKSIEIKPIEIKPVEIEVKAEKTEKIEEIKPKIHAQKRETPKKTRKTRKPQKKDDNFFNRIKGWALANSMEILNVEGFSKNELHLKVKDNSGGFLLSAFNKKRLSDADFIKANKKARELGLKYTVLSLGEPMKKMNEFIDAAKNLSDVRKIE